MGSLLVTTGCSLGKDPLCMYRHRSREAETGGANCLGGGEAGNAAAVEIHPGLASQFGPTT